MKIFLRLLLLLALVGGIGFLYLRNSEPEGSFTSTTAELPMIDFPLLDEARSLDLIDMQLDFPASLKELDGRRVGLVGFMAPFDNLEDMRRCMIVPSYVGCTFCSPPSLSQVAFINQGDGSDSGPSFPFIEEPSFVVGTLRLSLPESDHEGKHQGFLYSIENATVTPHSGVPLERAAVHGSGGATTHQPDAPLAPVALDDLSEEVSSLIGRTPLRPIEVDRVSTEVFREKVLEEVEAMFPEATRASRTQAFHLLGMVPPQANWLDLIAAHQLSRRVTYGDRQGERILLLESIEPDHPYARLELVGELADAILRQHFPARDAAADNDDTRRAEEALHLGTRIMAVYRYARTHGISPAVKPPADLLPEESEGELASVEFDLWLALPSDVGPFFVDYHVGATGSMTGIDAVFAKPPATTMELFRPRWHEDPSLWQQNPVPPDFADSLMETTPSLTDVLGLGGLVPWLAKWYPIDPAKSLAGRWAGDRWAVWEFADGSSALLLEIRWQDEDAAIGFRDSIPEDSGWKLGPHQAGSVRTRLWRGSSPEAVERLSTAVKGDS